MNSKTGCITVILSLRCFTEWKKERKKRGGGKMEQLTKLPLQDVFIWAFRVQKFSLSRSMSYDRDVTSRCCFKLRICEPLFHVDWIDRGKEESSFTGFRVFHFFHIIIVINLFSTSLNRDLMDIYFSVI